MNSQRYFDALATKLRGLFLMIKNGHEVPLDEKRYVEGFMHASMDLGLANREELEALMESINQEVFGVSIAERRKRYQNQTLSSGSAHDTPTYQRRGIHIDLGDIQE